MTHTPRHEDAAMSDSHLIDAYTAHLRAAGYSPHTITARAGVLHRLHTHLPYGLAYAATDELDQWLAGHRHWAPWTRATYAEHIRAAYRWWTDAELLDGDPTLRMAHPRTPRCLPNPVTAAELELALERSREPWYTVILLAAYAGLRVAEIAALQRQDITDCTIRVVCGKGGDPGTADTHHLVWAHLRGRPPGPVILNQHGQPVNGRWITYRARRHFNAIGLPRVTPHRFRHWYATALLDAGVDIRVVQEMMRHRNIASTQGYTKVRTGQRRNAIATLPAPTGAQQSTEPDRSTTPDR